MQRKYLIMNWLLFIVFFVLLAIAFKFQIEQESILLNEDIALLFVCLSIPLKIYKIDVGQYVIFVGLFILLFSPLFYSYTLTDGDNSTTYHETRFNSLISPLTFVFLILFLVINHKIVIDFYRLLTKGSAKDQNDDLSKKIEFYYTKFNSCPVEELDNFFKMFNDYPVEARIALNRIRQEKRMN